MPAVSRWAVTQTLRILHDFERRRLVRRQQSETDERQKSLFAATAPAGRHGLDRPSPSNLYAEEYGWDATYEALAAEIVAQFIKNYDPKRERCWIAEKDGARVGAVFVAKASDEIAKLRLLHDGKRLVAITSVDDRLPPKFLCEQERWRASAIFPNAGF
jgi:hypothetical protein